MAINLAELEKIIKAEGFSLSATELAGLKDYLELLMHWNKVINLSGARTWQKAVQNLIIDSFYLADFIKKLSLNPKPLCWDLGAGAGLPGIPLRLMWQGSEYWMIELRQKRGIFLANVLAKLSLPDTHIFRGSMEEFFAANDNVRADIILSRAFMPWQKLLPRLAGHLKDTGFVIFLLNDLPYMTNLSWEIAATTEYTVYGKVRYIVAVREDKN